MTKILYLMQGIPGSGKSSMAAMIAKQTDGMIYSTDDLWYDEKGKYNFDATRLGEMHRLNQRLVSEAMVDGTASIIVDNTNLTAAAIEPYVVLAQIHEYTIQVVRVECDLAVAVARNAMRPEDRRVPEPTLRNMAVKMANLSGSLAISAKW
jgi:predicted kinase